MNNFKEEYYVYVYIDPRNLQEFYYGKGKGNRKEAHLFDQSDSEKVRRIKAILKEGLSPIIKVIARDLSEREAFLIEKTLIWKLGNNLTNVSSGHFADKFRPHNSLHLDLAGYDFKNGIYYVNVGEGDHRCWEDCKEFGFLSAGQHPKWSDPLRTLNVGDVVVAYLKGNGYVGIGKVLEQAVPVKDFKINSEPLSSKKLKVPNIYENSENEKSEFILRVKWLISVDREEAKWKPKSGLFSSQLIKASLQAQPKTINFIESEFEFKFKEYLLEE